MSFKEARKSANMTIEAVAAELHISRQAVYLWEIGKCMPSSDKLQKLADLYGCTVDELLGRKENRERLHNR